MSRIIIGKIIPILLTFLTFFVLSTVLYGLLLALNSLNLNSPIVLDFRRRELLFGIAVYLKTAIDFAIFMGNLIHSNPGWKKKIAIAFGTALGNALGTFLILTIWTVFREFNILMIIMIFIASVALLRMAEESLEEFLKQKKSFIKIRMPVSLLQEQLNVVNTIFRPILKFFVRDLNLTKTKKLSFANLIVFSLTIPFILGINDFSAYIALSQYINVFGFSLGILFGHMLLTIGLFANPKLTVSFVKHPFILISGALGFIAIGLFGFYQSAVIFLKLI
jgi:hypothetical protein